jgi:hypothetical protein
VVTVEPQATTAWAKGADGERRLARALERGLGDEAVILHDRRIPGSRSNIDHLIVGPSGVWVVDAKFYKGRIEQRDCGSLLARDWRLYVAGRDRSRLASGLQRQIEAATRALVDESVPVHAALCFVSAEWTMLSRPFQQDGVWVLWPRELVNRVRRPSVLGRSSIDRISRTLAAALRAA